MKLYFHPEAEAEFNQAIEYYEQHQSGLGIELVGEVYATIARIEEYPDAWTPMSKNTRRCLTNRFPYGVIYQIKGDNTFAYFWLSKISSDFVIFKKIIERFCVFSA